MPRARQPRRAPRPPTVPPPIAPERRAALREALASWRATRAAAIAEAIDGLTEAALAGWIAPAPRTNRAFQVAWLAALADDAHRGWAARAMLQQLPGPGGDRAAACAERLDALRVSPADPRVGRAVVELIGQPLPMLRAPAVADAIVAALAVHGDERTAAIAARRRETADPDDAALIDRALAAQPACEREPTAAERQRFVERRADPVARTQIDALLREVYARPDADDVRLVLADALLAQGDPRGELIALQLAGSDDDRRLDRIDVLLRQHGKRWLGMLREVAFRARFERGFASRLELNGRWTATEQGWARHVVDPVLATIEDLVPGRSVGPIYARFVTSPAMTALRRIEVFDAPTLDALRATSADLVHVACPRWKVGRYVHELVGNVLPACERFARLRSFAVYIDGVPGTMASRLFDQLTALTVAGGFAQGLALWPRLPRTMALTIARTALLDDCATARVAWAGALELRREAGGVVGRGTGDWLLGELIEHFAALPAELVRLEIEDAGAQHAAALVDAARRRGIELELRAAPRRTGYLAGFDR